MSVISKMTFDNGSTKNLISSTFYGKCDTAAGTAAKTVTIGGWDESVKDNVSGVTVHVYFTLGNSATDPTLNIDGGGAHPIYVEDNVKAAAFPAGVYSLTLVSVVISGQAAWCWLMEAKTDWSYISNKPSLDFIPTTGGNVTGDIVLLKQVSSGAPGDSYGITFQRGSLTDNYNDWRIVDSGGYLHFYERGSGSTAWNDRVVFNTTGDVSATSFTGSGASLTSLNASNLSSGTVPIARLPDLSSTYIPASQKGAASGVATLDASSKVSLTQRYYLFAKCTTAAATAAKTASVTGFTSSVDEIPDMVGVTIFLAFSNYNTASSPTLNINSTAAYPIVVGSYQDPANAYRFSAGVHAFTLVKQGSDYYWMVNEGRDSVPEAPVSAGTYLLTVSSSGNVSWSAYTPPTAATTGTVTIGASGWSGNGPYSHSVTISGTTANSKIDLQPDSTVLAQMTTDGTTAIYIENNNGTLTAWAMGAKPTASLTIQYTKTEVG